MKLERAEPRATPRVGAHKAAVTSVSSRSTHRLRQAGQDPSRVCADVSDQVLQRPSPGK